MTPCSPPGGRLPLLKRVCFWVLALPAAAPDLVIIFDTTGHVLRDRKGESSPDGLERDRIGFANLVGRLGTSSWSMPRGRRRLFGLMRSAGSGPLSGTDGRRDDGAILALKAGADGHARGAAGCSCAASVLRRYRSSLIVTRSRAALRLLEEAGVVPSTSWVVGRPGWLKPAGDRAARADRLPPRVMLKWPPARDGVASLVAQRTT